MDLELQQHNINSSTLSQKIEKINRSKQDDINELKEQLDYVLNGWYKSSQDLWELALKHANELDDQAEMLNFRLQEAIASFDEGNLLSQSLDCVLRIMPIGLKSKTLKDLSSIAWKVLSGIIEEDNNVIQELANTADAMRLKEKSSTGKLIIFKDGLNFL